MIKAKELLAYLSLIHKGDWNLMYDDIRRKRRFDTKEAVSIVEKCGCKYVTLVDDDYPTILKECIKPPLVLWYRGNLELLSRFDRNVTIVGSRKCSDYGEQMTKKVASELAERGIGIVSGLARGIDTAALSEANRFGKAIAVLGNGIDVNYPEENAALQEEIGRTGLLISEYPEGVGPEASHFPCRNRILACLSKLTLVAEAYEKSGTLITAAYALNLNRELACFPFRADEGSAGNMLIKDGALLVESASEVLEAIDYKLEKAKKDKRR